MEKGLQFDRRWMLVDENNLFMTQRNFPKMALIKLQPVHTPAEGFSVSNRENSIFLPLGTFGTTVVKTKVWEDDVTTLEVSAGHSQWFSEQLGVSCRLVAFEEKSPRPVDARFALHHEQVSLADAYPLLIIGRASLDDLNGRLKNPVPMNRFRPNLIFTGGEAYEEDGWNKFTVGKNRFAGVKPCSRCITTTINQETGEKGVEPLATLAGYRKKENKIYFGQNVIAIDKNEIHEGDEIIVE
jgi:uncharacterized protein YcbX